MSIIARLVRTGERVVLAIGPRGSGRMYVRPDGRKTWEQSHAQDLSGMSAREVQEFAQEKNIVVKAPRR
jgi:hypothetical protein